MYRKKSRNQVIVIKKAIKRTTILTGNLLPSHKPSKCVPTQIPHADKGQYILNERTFDCWVWRYLPSWIEITETHDSQEFPEHGALSERHVRSRNLVAYRRKSNYLCNKSWGVNKTGPKKVLFSKTLWSVPNSGKNQLPRKENPLLCALIQTSQYYPEHVLMLTTSSHNWSS